jgi:hypothetical protein
MALGIALNYTTIGNFELINIISLLITTALLGVLVIAMVSLWRVSK